MSVLAASWRVAEPRAGAGMQCRMVIFSGPMRTSLTSSRSTRWQSSIVAVAALARRWYACGCPRGFPVRSVNWAAGGPTATERHLLADVRLLDGVTLVVSPSADKGRPNAHAEYRPSGSSDAPGRRAVVRYSQSLLSGRRAAGLPAKEPIQEPTWTDFRRHPATPGDCRAWSSAH